MIGKRKRKYPENLINMLGKKYGKLTVTGTNYIESKGVYTTHYVSILCDCGKSKIVRYDSILSGDTNSCGCLQGRPVACGIKFPVDSSGDHPLNGVWSDMKRRCNNPKRKDYHLYGGRGIKVCDEWNIKNYKGFINFLSDMEADYEEGLELERKDTNGNYCKSNCIWVDRKTQTNNLRTNLLLKGYGITLTNSEWVYLLQIPEATLLSDRVHSGKVDIEVLLSSTLKDRQYNILYKGEIKSASAVFVDLGISAGKRNRLITNHGDCISALNHLCVDFKLVKVREKHYLSFDEGIEALKLDKTTFGKSLRRKINDQTGGKYDL